MPHKNCFGVNAVARPASGNAWGVILVGDTLQVLRMAEGRLRTDEEEKALQGR